MATRTETFSERGANIAAIVAEVCALLERSSSAGHPPLLCDFARHFLTRAPRAYLLARSPEQLAAIAAGAFAFLQEAGPDVPNVQVKQPEEEGWTANATILRANLTDRPFVVDTIREYFSSEPFSIHYFVHPVLGVGRDAGGRVLAIADPGEGDRDEALVHCELSRMTDPERLEWIRSEVERRLGDVIAATEDFQAMLSALAQAAASVHELAHSVPNRAEELNEVADFLRWLRNGNFVFLGYRAYDILETDDTLLRVESGSGLGILRDEARSTYADGVPLSELPEALQRRVAAGPTLIVSKANAESTVHRRARMDYIGVKKLDTNGRVVGERRFLGLFTSKAYAEDAETIPILRRKLERILRESGAQPGSHDFKEIQTIFNSMPKEELFQASTAELLHEVQTVLALLFADEVHVTVRPDPIGRGVSVMVILPRGRFSSEVRLKIQEAVARRLRGTVLNYYLSLGAGDQARLHFHLSADPEIAEALDPHDLEQDVVQIIRSWDDRLLDALDQLLPAGEAQQLVARYAPALSEEYRAATLPHVAVHDIEQLERLRRGGPGVAIDLRSPRGRGRPEDFAGVTVLKLFLRDERLVLSEFMPILESLGLRVIEVTPFGISGPELPSFMIYSFAVTGPGGEQLPLERAPLLAESILAVRSGTTPNDALNALTLSVGLRWREVDVLRTYVNYLFQLGVVPSRVSITRALGRNPEVARTAFELFRARFDPDEPTEGDGGAPLIGREARIEALRGALGGALQAVATLADDRALRKLAAVLDATVRTNYFRHGGADPTSTSGGVPYISIKVRSADVEELRRSRLVAEVYVFSARMEGVHLRGAHVSRGGIRWSDRVDDYRTEVMGLVQTQIVKNAVIVPGGSKGGFITKLILEDRDEMLAEAAEQYRTLIRGILDVTDNLVDGEIVPPERVIRYDGDDPYLVVAADKGTAHLSDAANAVAAEYGFWLGDAFASGGSQGYDHKKEGITARGAWVCVKRHFREMGKNIQEEPFTVIGVGDMSGDVFGNGMLLSRQIRLIAAFDHRHVFIDPDPDPASSYAERERLFRMGRSSWADYDQSTLSGGGLIVPRDAKQVVLTPEAREALDLGEAPDPTDGEALVRAVLRAPAELLWNGGIGTYVKDPEETHAEVGDTGNDAVRIDADELRCKVIGEGGNLGLTQRARIRFSLQGGRLNTDALDNSAGVDMSDHEVNLKILLTPSVAAGRLSLDDRNRLLREMTDPVCDLVLAQNRSQSLAVSLDEVRSRDGLNDFAALITAFERDKLLERGPEGIPSSDTLQERAAEGLGLTRPTLSVLLAYAKLHAHPHLLSSDFPDDPVGESYLVAYFPEHAIEAAGVDQLRRHRLRREIVTTSVVNDLVDLMGSSFLLHAARDTGRDVAEVVRAWVVSSLFAGAPRLRRELGRLEQSRPTSEVYRWYFGLARVLARTTRWVLANLAPDASVATILEQHLDGLKHLRKDFGQIVTGADQLLFTSILEEIRPLAIEDAFAERIVTLRFLPQLLDILRIARELGTEPVVTGRAYYRVSERYDCARLRQALQLTSWATRWEKRYAHLLVEDIDRAHRSLARQLLRTGDAGGDLERSLESLELTHARAATAFREQLHELDGLDPTPLAAYGVAIRMLADVAAAR
jgi:glutamate dehydrogenase